LVTNDPPARPMLHWPIMPTSFEYRLWQLRILLWIGVWTALCVFISMWTMAGGVALLGLGLALFHFLRSTNRGPFAQRPERSTQETPVDPAQRERDARYMVTQVLRTLTRAQVAYLCQSFSSDKEASAWLRNALPKGFRDTIDDLREQLELARRGRTTHGTRLAVRVLERRDEVLASIAAMERAVEGRKSHIVNNPVIFVITEHLGEEGDEPEVVTLAGWDPDKPALLPRVDVVNLFSERGAERQIRGQAPFPAVRNALGDELEVVETEPEIYAVPRQEEDPVKRGVKLDKVPLGFVIGTAELV